MRTAQVVMQALIALAASTTIMSTVQSKKSKNWMPMNGDIKHWRKHALHHLKQVCEKRRRWQSERTSASATDIGCDQMDIYQFGVFTGRSLKPLAAFSAKNNLSRRIWGFDSFSGLPQDASLSNKPFMSRRGQSYAYLIREGGFRNGSFSAMQTIGASTVADTLTAVSRYVASDRVTLIPGFFNETLTRSLASSRAMRPAIYVDIDVDIYSATFEALDWLFHSKLITNGTLIGYDDFNYGMPKSHRRSWKEIQRSGQLEGEPRAHSEIEAKWGVRFVHEARAAPISGGEAGWLFRTLIS
jgi:hypothetical protein